MRETLNKLKKLKGRSLDEFRVRGVQAWAAYAERRGLSAQARVPGDAAFYELLDKTQAGPVSRSAEGLLTHFRTRTSPAFFAAFAAPEETLAELRRRFGATTERAVVERANHIVAGRFDLLGLRDLHFGEPIDWHLEPLSGKRTPLVHWSLINFLDPNVAGDKKITWELNRHQYFATLGRAYWYTREERYARTFVAHLDAWMEANPPTLGINWASSLEVAFRAISWLWALYFFKDSPSLKPAIFLRALKFLYLHARHLETYLSTYFSPNTHLTGEALGLFYLGTLLPEFACASRWREQGRRIMLAELHRHVRPDGVYFEQSSYYHRYTADFYTHLYVLTRASGEAVENLLAEKLTALLDHLMHLTRPDGTTGYYGDDDGGKLLMLDERAANDFRATLSTGAALFARPDYKMAAGAAAEESLWLLGAAALRGFDNLAAQAPAHTSRAFDTSGYYVMRDTWTEDANYLLLDCGPHGSLSCGHAHADALSFELAARGRTLIVDPGTYTYTGAAEWRDYFRSTAAHNTLTIDGESSSVPGDGAFKWQHIACARPRRWESRPRFDFFEGEQDGYLRLTAAPALHTRSVFFVKGDYWIIRDRVTTAGAHRYDLNFHFAAHIEMLIDSQAGTTAAAVVRARALDATGLDISVFARDGAWRAPEGWVSERYGERVPAPVAAYSMQGVGAQEFITFLVPADAASEKRQVREIEAVCGRAFEVSQGSARDVLIIGAERGGETSRLASDFEWTWARFASGTGDLTQMVLLGGRRLRIDGREVFRATERVGYVSAQVGADELMIETDAVEKLFIAPVGAAGVRLNGQPYPTAPPSARESNMEDLCVGLTE